MRLIDSTLHRCLPGLGLGKRWLKERLAELEVRIHVSDGCLQELVQDAEAATWREFAALGASAGSYLECLRRELDRRAQLLRVWTGCDEPLSNTCTTAQAVVRIARKYAIPRPWRLTDPVALVIARPRPCYWRWASAAGSAATSS